MWVEFGLSVDYNMMLDIVVASGGTVVGSGLSPDPGVNFGY
jgi:hypothetical protein